MKILYLTNLPSPYRVDFFNELGKYCQLLVLFERESASDRDKRWTISDFKRFEGIFLKGKKIGTDASLSLEVIHYLNSNYDAIILGGYSSPTYMIAIEYMKFHGIPFMLNADGGFVKKDSWFKQKIKNHYIGSASAWLSSGVMADKYLLHYRAKSEFIYQYPFTSVLKKQLCHPSEDQKKRLKESLGISEEKIAIAVGQFIPRKGFEYLIQASGKIPKQYGVYLIGGKAGEDYIKLGEKYGAGNVHFLDFMERHQLSLFYMAADIFVFPTREDIWGLVLNEAMSYGLPSVVSSKANAAIELIDDNVNGYLVDPECVDNMVDKMLNLFDNDDKRICMGENALKKISSYTIEKMALEHINIINKWKNL